MQPPARKSPQVVRARPDRPLVYERLSDPILVRRVKDGDQQALAALCTRHAARVHRIALHVLRDPDDANDAAQESLVKLVRRVHRFRGDSRFSTWLHRLVVNTCKDVAQARWATEHRTEPLLEDLRVASEGDPARALAASEARRELGACLAELPAAQATVVTLKHGFDVPFEEISAATGLPVGTAKCYAHRARATLGRGRLRERLTA
ncbi:MAG: sigma-70 family RNA polymerase sigma factor [Actinobacteria bacterium]|nr:sigma-70 family RNA polymerase sigma factor [Actinomycetota bacterium]